MALNDWQQFSTDLTRFHMIYEVITPILGTGSLKFQSDSGGGNRAAAVDLSAKVGATPGLTYALQHGKIRTLIKPFASGASDVRSGIYSLTSQQYIVNAGTCYTFELYGPTLVFRLAKYTLGGLLSGAPTVLQSTGAWVSGSVYGIELEWHSDLDNLNGTLLTARMGTATNFSDLTTIMTYHDTSSPFTQTFSEGLFFSDNAAIAGNVYFDETTVTRLIPV